MTVLKYCKMKLLGFFSKLNKSLMDKAGKINYDIFDDLVDKWHDSNDPRPLVEFLKDKGYELHE